MTTDNIDFDHLLRSNLERVFNERDDDKRRAAVAELFVEAPIMYEPTNIVRGQSGISRVAGELLKQFGPAFRFVPDGIAVGHHGLGRLAWHGGPEHGRVAVTGADVALVEGGRISRLWVLLNPK
ncbi:nuclear transport factor 2 family protein [Bradyrhizobium sp. CCGE-LA001]|uniref:nuclear transport factor 2 family protein n=1 Tax=Bradyrhizobium sp. CCGE-LA001 TaxID=1223566 RepID=UPI0002AA7A34|nr:nuclear transport factor 2 family protein [Bradyrhizobium sp. CCGE-LA001]AMA55330.1 hypothetical protein BCCGELA001_02955 [Bradyrhizobium sp. CCGE-LA001]